MDKLFVDEKPDLVLSGINHGSNASTAMWYSGTIGAAREAAMSGVPAIGVSLDNMSRNADFTVVEQLLPGILDKLLAHLPADHAPLYNINFPDLPASQIKGVKVCSQGVERWEDEFVTPDQLGRVEEVELEEGEVLYFMAGDVVPSPLNDEDTDNWANDNGYVAITPQDLDNTHWGDFENLKTIF